MKEYVIKTVCSSKGLENASGIAFQSGKGACGLVTYNHPIAEVYVWGKFSDMVRVYSALKNNGFNLVLRRVAEG